MKSLGKSVVLFCHITSQVEDEPYPNLLHEMKGRGFPSMRFLDTKGELLHIYDGAWKLEAIQDAADGLNELSRLEVALAAGDEKAAPKVFIQKLKLGMFSNAEADKQRAELKGLSRKQSKDLDGLVRDQKIVNLAKSTDRNSKESLAKAAKEFAEITKASGTTKTNYVQRLIWPIMVDHAKAVSDKRLMKKALKATKKAYGKGIDKDWVRKMETTLKHMKR